MTEMLVVCKHASVQGIIGYTETLAKESKLVKLLQGATVDARAMSLKKSTGFSCMFVTANFFKELFTFTYNGIAASVSCVSSTLVVPNARVLCLLRCTQTKNDGANRTNTKTVTLFRSGTQTFNSGRSLGYACGNKSIIFSMIYESQ